MKAKYVLEYSSAVVGEPVVYILIKDFGLKVNILRAEIGSGNRGEMLVMIEGAEADIGRGIAYLEGRQVSLLPLSAALGWKEDACVDCGACTGVCFSGALALDPATARLKLDRELCVACGLCVKACPFSCLSLKFGD